jgi:hypothetical protein
LPFLIGVASGGGEAEGKKKKAVSGRAAVAKATNAALQYVSGEEVNALF